LDEQLDIPLHTPEEEAHVMRQKLGQNLKLAQENAKTRHLLRATMRELETVRTANRHLTMVIDTMHLLIMKAGAHV
jgi:hypothetical protein